MNAIAGVFLLHPGAHLHPHAIEVMLLIVTAVVIGLGAHLAREL